MVKIKEQILLGIILIGIVIVSGCIGGEVKAEDSQDDVKIGSESALTPGETVMEYLTKVKKGERIDLTRYYSAEAIKELQQEAINAGYKNYDDYFEQARLADTTDIVSTVVDETIEEFKGKPTAGVQLQKCRNNLCVERHRILIQENGLWKLASTSESSPIVSTVPCGPCFTTFAFVDYTNGDLVIKNGARERNTVSVVCTPDVAPLCSTSATADASEQLTITNLDTTGNIIVALTYTDTLSGSVHTDKGTIYN